MTTGELKAQPEKTHFFPEEQASINTLLKLLCSMRSISGTKQHGAILGPRRGCPHPGPGLAQQSSPRVHQPHPDPA